MHNIKVIGAVCVSCNARCKEVNIDMRSKLCFKCDDKKEQLNKMKDVLEEIENMGAYDPLLICDKRFWRIGCEYVCNAYVKLDNTIFDEEPPMQNPNSLSYHKIKVVSCKIKYTYIDF